MFWFCSWGGGKVWGDVWRDFWGDVHGDDRPHIASIGGCVG